MKEKPLLTEVFGNSPLIKIIDFFLDNKLFDFSKEEIARGTGISKMTLYKYFDILIKLGILKESRKIGRATLYKLNLKNPIVKKLIEVEDFLIRKGYKSYAKIPAKVKKS